MYLTYGQTQCLQYFQIQATLASVIMTAVLFSVDHHIVAPMWRASSEYLDYLDYFYYPDYFDYPYYFDYPDYFMIFLNIVAPIVILF